MSSQQYDTYKAWISGARNGEIGPLNHATRHLLDAVIRLCVRREAYWVVHGPDAHMDGHGEVNSMNSDGWIHTLAQLKINVQRSNASTRFNEFRDWMEGKCPDHDDVEGKARFASLPDDVQNVINVACDQIEAMERYIGMTNDERENVPPPRIPPSVDDPCWTERMESAMAVLAPYFP